jgi:hypothetical protein
MRELFRQQRNEIQANHEKIKKIRDGGHESEVDRPSARRPAAGRRSSNRRLLQGLLLSDDAPAQQSEEPVDLSQALNKRSAGNFLKSRSVVLDQLQAEGQEIMLPEDNPEDVERQKEMDMILDQAKALNEALDNLDNQNPVDEPESEEASTPFFLPNKVLNFPKVKDSDSLAYRAEAIRAFLEREMGLEKMLALRQAVNSPDGVLDSVLADCEAGVVVLAQQLLVLEETITNS